MKGAEPWSGTRLDIMTATTSEPEEEGRRPRTNKKPSLASFKAKIGTMSWAEEQKLLISLRASRNAA